MSILRDLIWQHGRLCSRISWQTPSVHHVSEANNLRRATVKAEAGLRRHSTKVHVVARKSRKLSHGQ
jgi:hypothetical protein